MRARGYRRPCPRGAALALGTAIMLVIGVIYAWSVYSQPFSEGFGWTSAQLGLCFTVMLGCFCLGGIAGGAAAARLGVGFSMPAGGVLGCLGFGLCMFLRPERLWLLYLALAVAGLGVGFIYNGVLSAVVPRYGERRGFASGVLLMGYGSSSLLLGSLASRLIVSPDFGWHLTYLLTGAQILAAGAAGGALLRPPAARAAESGALPERAPGLTPRQMLRTSRFWLFFAAATIGTAFGSGLIAHGNYLFLEAGASGETAALGVGLVAVMNGLGRVLFGTLHDRLGFRVSLLTDAAVYIAAGLGAALALRGGADWALIAAMMAIGACYGAVPTISASVAGDFFGQAHYGRNLSYVNLNILLASPASAVIGAMETASGSYTDAIFVFTGLELVAVLLLALLSRTRPVI